MKKKSIGRRGNSSHSDKGLTSLEMTMVAEDKGNETDSSISLPSQSDTATDQQKGTNTNSRRRLGTGTESDDSDSGTVSGIPKTGSKASKNTKDKSKTNRSEPKSTGKTVREANKLAERISSYKNWLVSEERVILLRIEKCAE